MRENERIIREEIEREKNIKRVKQREIQRHHRKRERESK